TGVAVHAFARVLASIVSEVPDPAVVFGGVRATWDEDRLAAAVAFAVRAHVDPSTALEIDLGHRGELRPQRGVPLGTDRREVTEAVFPPDQPLVDPRELTLVIVEHLRAQRSRLEIDPPAM